MVVLFWVTLGLLVGAIAKLVIWDEDPARWSAVMLLSSLGAVFGGMVAGVLSPNSDVPGFDPTSIVLALIGASVLLWPYKIVIARRRGKATVEFPHARRAA